MSENNVEKTSADFQWNTDESEEFSFVVRTYDVSKAKQLIVASGPRPVCRVDVGGLKLLVGEPVRPKGRIHCGIRVDWNKAKEVDVEFPIILLTSKESQQVRVT